MQCVRSASVRFLIAAPLCLVLASMPLATASNPQDDCTMRGPILINSDSGPAGFSVGTDPTTGAPKPNSAQGVTGGTGAPDDPFRIEGWCIQLAHVPATAILIQDTTKAFVIQHNFITVADHGIVVNNAPGGAVQGNVIWDSKFDSIWVSGTSGTIVKNNTILGRQPGGPIGGFAAAEGVRVTDAPGTVVMENIFGTSLGDSAFDDGAAIFIERSGSAVVDRNTIDQIGGWGIWVRESSGVAITGNMLTSIWETGVLLEFANDSILENNTVDIAKYTYILDSSHRNTLKGNVGRGGYNDGVSVGRSENNTFENNLFEGGSQSGVILGAAHGTRFIGNTIREVDDWMFAPGLVVGNSEDVQILGNHFEANAGAGVSMWQSSAEVSGNTFKGNGFGHEFFPAVSSALEIREQSLVVLRHNNIAGNAAGLLAENGGLVDARENWWGCAQGPKHATCDSVEGDVRFAPWLKAPA